MRQDVKLLHCHTIESLMPPDHLADNRCRQHPLFPSESQDAGFVTGRESHSDKVVQAVSFNAETSGNQCVADKSLTDELNRQR